MKKFLNVVFVMLLVVTLAGCNKDKDKDKDNKGNEGDKQQEVKEYTRAELMEAASKAGYVVNDYIACSTGLTEDQMEGFTVDIPKSATESNSYCIIIAKSEDYAKQACEAVSSEFNTCIRNLKTVTFPETTASSEVVEMLRSIISGSPKKAPTYTTPEDTKK